MKQETTYFETPGPQNTQETIEAAGHRAKELGIRHIVMATRLGETALKAGEFFKDAGLNLVAISHQFGYLHPGEWLIDHDILRKLKELGVKVSTGTMPLSSPGRLYRPDQKRDSQYPIYNTMFPFDIIADTLKMFSQGMKVCVEIVVMAADMGLIPIDDEVIAMGGTGRGADTAVVIKPAHVHQLYKLRILEIIAKPRLSHGFK